MVPSNIAPETGVEIVTLTVPGATSALDAQVLKAASSLIAAGEASVVCLTPGGSGRVLAAPSEVLLVRADALHNVRAEVLEDLVGAGRYADPYTAILDLQWRLSLFGQTVVALDGRLTRPAARTVGESRRRVAGALRLLFTHLGPQLQGPVTAAAQLYLTTRAFAGSGADTSVLDLQRSPGADQVDTVRVPAAALVGALGLDTALDDLEALTTVRDHVQAHRRVPDRALAPRLLETLPHLLGVRTPADQQHLDGILDLLGIPALLSEPLHALVIYAPATKARVTRLVKSLGDDVRVRLVAIPTGSASRGRQSVEQGSSDADWADLAIFVSATFDDVPGVQYGDLPLVADLSMLDVAAWLQTPLARYRAEALRDLMARADVVLAADAGQRDVLLGALAGQGRVNPSVYDDDPTLLSLVLVDESGESLADYCRYPVRAADSVEPLPRPPQHDSDLAKAIQFLREGGPSMLASRAAGRLQRLGKSRVRRIAR